MIKINILRTDLILFSIISNVDDFEKSSNLTCRKNSLICHHLDLSLKAIVVARKSVEKENISSPNNPH